MWSQWTRGGPAGALYSVSTSGWMEGDNFLQWFEKMFVPAVSHMTTDAPVFLFFDGHHSHKTLRLVEAGADLGVGQGRPGPPWQNFYL